jgi:hypothetical protein
VYWWFRRFVRRLLLRAIRRRWPWLKHLFPEAGHDRTRLMDKATFLDFVVEIVRRSDPKAGFPGSSRAAGWWGEPSAG